MTSPETPLRVGYDGPCVKYRLLYVPYSVISVTNTPVRRRMSSLSPESGSHPCAAGSFTVVDPDRPSPRALSLSRNRPHVLANDFIVASFGIQIVSANDEHVAPVTGRAGSQILDAAENRQAWTNRFSWTRRRRGACDARRGEASDGNDPGIGELHPRGEPGTFSCSHRCL